MDLGKKPVYLNVQMRQFRKFVEKPLPVQQDTITSNAICGAIKFLKTIGFAEVQPWGKVYQNAAPAKRALGFGAQATVRHIPRMQRHLCR